MKVVRMIVYEGDEEWVKKTLSKSLNVGKTPIMGEERTITVVEKEGDIDLVAEINKERNSFITEYPYQH